MKVFKFEILFWERFQNSRIPVYQSFKFQNLYNLKALILIAICLKSPEFKIENIVYCATREKKVYFASVKFDSRAKRGKQSHE